MFTFRFHQCSNFFLFQNCLRMFCVALGQVPCFHQLRFKYCNFHSDDDIVVALFFSLDFISKRISWTFTHTPFESNIQWRRRRNPAQNHKNQHHHFLFPLRFFRVFWIRQKIIDWSQFQHDCQSRPATPESITFQLGFYSLPIIIFTLLLFALPL